MTQTEKMTQLGNGAATAGMQLLATVNANAVETSQKSADASNKLNRESFNSLSAEVESTFQAAQKDKQRAAVEGYISIGNGAISLTTGVASIKTASMFGKEQKELDNLDALLKPSKTGGTDAGAAKTLAAKIVSGDAVEAAINSKGLDAKGQVLDNNGKYRLGNPGEKLEGIAVEGKLIPDRGDIRIADIRETIAKDEAFKDRKNAFNESIKEMIKQKQGELQEKIGNYHRAFDTAQRSSDAFGRGAQSLYSSSMSDKQAQDQKEATLNRNAQDGLKNAAQGQDRNISNATELTQQAAQLAMATTKAYNGG